MNTLKRRALGRGLDALIPIVAEPETTSPTLVTTTPLMRPFFVVPVEDIYPSPEQPRKTFHPAELDELAQSIKEHGILQPLLVRKRREGGYWLICGERRWRAAGQAALHEVPVLVREASDKSAFELALVENVQRADLNPIEEAEAYFRLCEEMGCTQEEVAARVGKDRATVANALRLLKLPLPVRQMVQDGRLTMGHARALLGCENPEAMLHLAKQVTTRGLSVRATEGLVRRLRNGTPGNKPPTRSASIGDLEQKLTRTLGARVRVHDRGHNQGGTIEIGYTNLDDLDRLLDVLLVKEHDHRSS